MITITNAFYGDLLFSISRSAYFGLVKKIKDLTQKLHGIGYTELRTPAHIAT